MNRTLLLTAAAFLVVIQLAGIRVNGKLHCKYARCIRHCNSMHAEKDY